VIEVLFESAVTPNPNAIFSELQFTTNCSDFNNFTAGTVFQNPLMYMCAVFTYDQMTPGAQWTALWYRNGELVHYETIPWNGETGGFGFTEWRAPASDWLPGTYEVQIFVGLEWKQIGQFIVEGDAPTAVPTTTPSITPTPSKTSTPTSTGTVTQTPTATRTNIPTLTPLPTNTP
jgi:type VI secretion system secreted protein VgrG